MTCLVIWVDGEELFCMLSYPKAVQSETYFNQFAGRAQRKKSTECFGEILFTLQEQLKGRNLPGASELYDKLDVAERYSRAIQNRKSSVAVLMDFSKMLCSRFALGFLGHRAPKYRTDFLKSIGLPSDNLVRTTMDQAANSYFLERQGFIWTISSTPFVSTFFSTYLLHSFLRLKVHQLADRITKFESKVEVRKFHLGISCAKH